MVSAISPWSTQISLSKPTKSLTDARKLYLSCLPFHPTIRNKLNGSNDERARNCSWHLTEKLYWAFLSLASLWPYIPAPSRPCIPHHASWATMEIQMVSQICYAFFASIIWSSASRGCSKFRRTRVCISGVDIARHLALTQSCERLCCVILNSVRSWLIDVILKTYVLMK